MAEDASVELSSRPLGQDEVPAALASASFPESTKYAPTAGATVKCYLRLKPGALDPAIFRLNGGSLVVKPPLRPSAGPNAQSRFDFALTGILGGGASQEEVFDTIALPVLDSVLGGVTGAVLAYGQTGSGKTFSMSGGRSYEERGIVPRAIAHAFAAAEGARQEVGRDVLTFRISYLEIYNDRVIDLLRDIPADLGGVGGAPPAEVRGVARNGRVDIAEDGRGRVLTPGLRCPRVGSEGEALALLFEGEANRALAEHALNAGSSRSHAVFTLYVEQSMEEEDVAGGGGRARRRPRSPEAEGTAERVRVSSKMHLVDLAGSERLAKTRSDGTTLSEATFINSSLSFLEQCVVALLERAEGGRSHVPFRSSKLTRLLQEALGGACNTRLLATAWPDAVHVDETLSTLRFAGRMMRVRTQPSVGVEGEGRGGEGGEGREALARLRATYEGEVAALRRELALHDALAAAAPTRAALAYAPLSLGEVGAVAEACAAFVGGEEGGAEGVGAALPTVRHLHAALACLRTMAREGRAPPAALGPTALAYTAASVAISSASAPASATRRPGPAQGMRQDAARAVALEAWREGAGADVSALWASARAMAKDKRAAYNVAAGGVNEAKRGVDAAMAELAGAGEMGAAALQAAKEGYKARHTALAAVKAELEYAQGQADVLGRRVAAEFEKAWAAGADGGRAAPPPPAGPLRTVEGPAAYEASIRGIEAKLAEARSPQRRPHRH
jgi:kinesin family protein 6/9